MTNEDPRDAALEPNPIDALRVQIVAVAVIITPGIYAVVAVLLKQFSMPPDGGFVFKSGELGPAVPIIGCVIAVAASIAAVAVRRALTQKPMGTTLPGRLRTTLICLAVAETGAVLGLVYFLLTGDLRQAVFMMGIALVGSIYLFPSRHWLIGDAQDQR